MKDLMTSVVLITGASSGFGTEFSRIFASKGKNLLIIARSEDKLLKLILFLYMKKRIQQHVSIDT